MKITVWIFISESVFPIQPLDEPLWQTINNEDENKEVYVA